MALRKLPSMAVILATAIGFYQRRDAALVRSARVALSTLTLGGLFGPFLGVSLGLLSAQLLPAGIASTLMSIVPSSDGAGRGSRVPGACHRDRGHRHARCARGRSLVSVLANSTLAIDGSAAAVGASSAECVAGQRLTASPVRHANFTIGATRALNCVPATIAGLAATLT